MGLAHSLQASSSPSCLDLGPDLGLCSKLCHHQSHHECPSVGILRLWPPSLKASSGPLGHFQSSSVLRFEEQTGLGSPWPLGTEDFRADLWLCPALAFFFFFFFQCTAPLDGGLPKLLWAKPKGQALGSASFLWFILSPPPGTRPKGQGGRSPLGISHPPFIPAPPSSVPGQEKCFSALCVGLALRIALRLLHSSFPLKGPKPTVAFLFFFFLFRAIPGAYGVHRLQVPLELQMLWQCQIQAKSEIYTTAHGSSRSLMH